MALLAGLVSFFSPCVVPLLPGYLSYATGLGAAEVVEGSPHSEPDARWCLAVRAGIRGGLCRSRVLVAGSAGRLLAEYRAVITRVLGVLIILLGLIFAGLLPISQRDLRLHRIPAAVALRRHR